METQVLIETAAGVLLSTLMDIIPAFKKWFDAQETGRKRLVTVGLIVAVSATLFGISCAGWLEGLFPGAKIACTEQGIQELIRIIGIVTISSQTSYTLLFKKSTTETIKNIS